MNEQKISIIASNSSSENLKNDSYEEYQIIKEDYCSSPRCGIKSKKVTKSVDKIIFTPLEISKKPYFKYCVTPAKDEHFKYDFSQSETNHTRNQEDKNQKKNNKGNNSNNQKNSYLDTNKDELKEEKEKEENASQNDIEENGNITNITKYLNIVDKKGSDTNENNETNVLIVNTSNDNEEKKTKLKARNKNKNKCKNKKVSLLSENQNNNDNLNNLNKNNENRNSNLNSIISKERRKISFNDTSDNNKEKKVKKSPKNMHNLFLLSDDNNKNTDSDMMQFRKARPKRSSVFQSIKLTKEAAKNLKKKLSSFRVIKDKKDPIKVISLRTTTSINRLKDKKKNLEDIKKTNTSNFIRDHLFNVKKSKELKEKLKMKIYENDNSEESKPKNKSNNNITHFNKSKKKSKHIKGKSFGEKSEAYKPTENLYMKKYDSDGKRFHNSDALSQKKNINSSSFKLKIEENLKKEKYETPKNFKGRRGSRSGILNNDNKSKNDILLTVKREKENIINKKFTTNFTNFLDKNRDKLKDKDKDKDKDKEKIKEKMKDKIKDKVKDMFKEKNNDNINIKNKSKSKDKEKEKEKEKDKKKEKEKENDDTNNLKSSTRTKKDKKKNKKKEKNKTKENKIDTMVRKDKSRTHIYHPQNNYLCRSSTKKLSVLQSVNLSAKNHLFENNKFSFKRMNSREQSLKSDYQLSLGPLKFHRPERRNSTKIIHFKPQQEKITAYTNKQNIDNINDYTRQCLEIIPDLYTLKEMPRCKNKIRPIFTKAKSTKKIALFDLDETIVHCIGEINMNNVESFSRQSDAKIKVLLPGGKQVVIGINIRPHWEEALNIIKDKYHIVAYTASHESYADSVINYLDPEKKYFEYRLYRSHCVLCDVNEMKFYVKDLGILEEFCDLKDVVLIDNSVLSFAYHLDNGIPISPFYDSKNDSELLDISNFLFRYAEEDDIRNKLREVYKLSEYLEIIKNNVSEESITVSPSISVVQEDEEGEKTNCLINKKKISSNLNKTLENSVIEENKSEGNNNEDEYLNNSICILKKRKSVSINNLKHNEIINSFEKIDINKIRKSVSFKEKNNKKFDKKIYDFMNNKNYINAINKSFGLKKKKFKSFRSIDINFKKEWDEKQKELNNK